MKYFRKGEIMTSNPMLNSRVVENVITDSKPMTVQGAINKTMILLAIVVLSGYYTWTLCAQGFADKASLLAMVSAIAGFILALIASFNPKSSKITAPAYALCEGLLVGSVSYMYAAIYEGIVLHAVGITLLTMFVMLFLYKTRAIQATDTFRKVVFISTVAIAIFYLAGFIGALFGHPMTIFNGSMIGIGVSLLICVIAALNFVLDFDFIEKGSNNNLPDYFEWYGGFALLVTVIWLYFEILRLLAQLNRRN